MKSKEPSRSRSILWHRSEAEEVTTELEFHIEMRTREFMEQGMDEEAARRRALQRMGDVGSINRTCRQLARQRNRRWRWQDFAAELGQDFRFALRRAGHSWSSLLLIVLTLGLGIGVNGAVFGLVHTVLLRPLPYPHPEQLVRIEETTPEGLQFSLSEPNFLDFRERSQTLQDMAAIQFPMPELTLLGGGEPIRLQAVPCTGNFFEVLQIDAVLGRTFSWKDSQPGTQSRVIVASHELWTRQFGQNPEIINRELNLNGENWTIIGVLPEGFAFPMAADIWMPFAPDPAAQREDHRLDAFGRRGQDQSLQSVRSELATIAASLGGEYPESNADWGIHLLAFGDWLIADDAKLGLWVLQVAVALILLLACANVSNLLLAQVSVRRTEIGLRSALGASRLRIVRQLLTESLFLSLLACGVGLALARWGIQVLSSWDPLALPRIEEVAFDGWIALFILGISLLVGLLCGVVPALQYSGENLSGILGPGRGTRAGASHRFRRFLVMGQVALAMILLIGSSLLLRSLWNLNRIDVGFDPDQVLVATLNLPQNRYPEGSVEIAQFYQQLLDKLGTVPGITSAGASMVSPFRGIRPSGRVAPEGAVEDREFSQIQWRAVTSGFFEASGLTVTRGQDFDNLPQENPGQAASLPVLINFRLARQLDLPENPVGKRLVWSRPGGTPLEVIGVVDDFRDVDIQMTPPPMLFLPQALVGWPQMTLFIRYQGGTAGLPIAIGRVIREIDPALPRPELSPLRENLRGALSQPRLNTELMAVFGFLALLLASLGVYGILAHSVRERRQEIGVRLALGADPESVKSLVVWQGLRLIVAGILTGGLAAAGLLRFIRGLLYETPLLEPWTLILVPLTLVAVGLMACYLPARRAARVDPLETLRAP